MRLAPAALPEARPLRFGRLPRLVAADAGFCSPSQERTVEEMGMKYVSVPNLSTKSEHRQRHQKKLWFRRDRNGETVARAASAYSNDGTD